MFMYIDGIYSLMSATLSGLKRMFLTFSIIRKCTGEDSDEWQRLCQEKMILENLFKINQFTNYKEDELTVTPIDFIKR